MKQPNILFIVIDALRARNLGCYGYSKPTSPNIDNLAQEGILFENAFSCVNATDPSLTTIFSGRYPRSHGIVRHAEGYTKEKIRAFNENRINFLPQLLKENGYVTLAVDWLGRWHKQGYDYYSGLPKKTRNKPLYWLMVESLKFKPLHRAISRLMKPTSFIEGADALTEKAMELLERVHEEKFFLFIHYWDTHYPYNPPQDYVDQFINTSYGENIDTEEILSRVNEKHRADLRDRLGDSSTVNEVLAKYDASIAYVDHHVQQLVEALKEYGVLDDSLIVLTSDHGESLTEHGIFFEHHGLYDVSINVPLILRYPELSRNKRIEGFVQHTDVTPTITDLLQIDASDFNFDGKSLVPHVLGEAKESHSAVYAEEADAERKAAIRTGEYKYIYTLSPTDAVCKRCGVVHGEMEELYDLNEDPEETRNVLQENPEIASRLRKQLDNLITHLEQKKNNGSEKEKTKPEETSRDKEEEKEVIERLKRLGYI